MLLPLCDSFLLLVLPGKGRTIQLQAQNSQKTSPTQAVLSPLRDQRRRRSGVLILILLLIWQLVSAWELVPSFLLPSPLAVVQALVSEFPVLLTHLGVTLVESALGLMSGMVCGFLCAYAMDRFIFLRDSLYPILVLTQTVPTVAMAPLLVLWFGYGILPKVILIIIVTFFPMAVNLYDGFSQVDPDSLRLLRAMGASRGQIFRYAKWPNALPGFFSALKVAASYSVVGAVIAEWLGGFRGLGVYMTRVRKAYAYDKMFAVIFLVSFLSLLLMGFVKLLERKAMPWLWREQKDKNHKLSQE